MKPETNTGFDASITVAQDREAVVKTVEKLPPSFHFPPVEEPQAVQMGCHLPFRGYLWSGWYRFHIQGISKR